MLLDDITVSRKHVILRLEEKTCRLIDAGSLNGSYLNGNIVEEAILQDGDRLQVGKYIFLYTASGMTQVLKTIALIHSEQTRLSLVLLRKIIRKQGGRKIKS